MNKELSSCDLLLRFIFHSTKCVLQIIPKISSIKGLAFFLSHFFVIGTTTTTTHVQTNVIDQRIINHFRTHHLQSQSHRLRCVCALFCLAVIGSVFCFVSSAISFCHSFLFALWFSEWVVLLCVIDSTRLLVLNADVWMFFFFCLLVVCRNRMNSTSWWAHNILNG